MNVRLLRFALAAMLCTSWQSVSAEITANDLLRGCQELTSGRTLYYHGGLCLGFLNGIHEMRYYYGDPPYCSPLGADYVQIARIVAKYLEEHPELLHRLAPHLAISALSEAFPCGLHRAPPE